MSEQESSKPSNPKDNIARNKVPLHLWPASATVYGAMGLLDGRGKYGRANFRAVGVSAMVYLDALARHSLDYAEGNDIDAESGLPNLCHMLACVAILVEATEQGNLNDDRHYGGKYYRSMIERFTKLVPVVVDRHKERDPHHYTIKDNQPEQPEQVSDTLKGFRDMSEMLEKVNAIWRGMK